MNFRHYPDGIKKIRSYLIAILSLSIIALCLFFYVKGIPSGIDNTRNSRSLGESLSKADSLLAEGRSEQALALYRSISSSGGDLPHGDTLSAKAALSASLMQAQIYFNKYHDYGRMLEALNEAKKISRKFGLRDDGVNFLFGYLYFTIGEQNNADNYFNEGTKYFLKVMESPTAVSSNMLHDAASNLILYSRKGNVKSLSGQSLEKYLSHEPDNHSEIYDFNILLDSLMRETQLRNYDNAIRIIDRIQKENVLPKERILPGIYFMSGQIASESGNYKDALRYLLLSRSLVNPENGQDMLLQVYEALADVNSKLGNKQKMGEYADSANRLRRQITSFTQISSIKNAEIKEQIDGMQTNLKEEKERSATFRMWSISGLVFGLLTVLIIVMLLVFLKRIREKNRTLYIRYVELLNLSSQNASIDNNAVPEEVNVSDDATDVTSSVHDEEDKLIPPQSLRKEDIEKIEQFLNTSDEIYSSDFSSASLSVKTGIKPRLLTSIILDHYHSSFRQLINSRRIRAVCMRLESGSEYYNMTVDAIAESVGIKSRTTFSSAFKRETGMTPAQYIRFARERKNV